MILIDINTGITGIRINMNLMKTKSLQDLGTAYETPHHPGCKEHVFDSDAYWECYIRHKTFTVYHQACTCKMAPDETGVVDNQLRYLNILISGICIYYTY